MPRLLCCFPALALLLLSACSSPGAAADRSLVLKDTGKVPAQLSTIEQIIDAGGLIKATEVQIYVSRNYEWDVSLTGDEVTAQKSMGRGEHQSVALGHPRAMFRNLDIRAYQKITFRKSGFDVVPFIRIRARGQAVYIEAPRGEAVYKVTEANEIIVHNADVRFVGKTASYARPRKVGEGSDKAGPLPPAIGLRGRKPSASPATSGDGRR